MYRIIVWGINDEYNKYYNQILFENQKGNLEVVANISRDKYCSEYDGNKILCKTEINSYEFDYLVVFNEKRFNTIKSEAISMGVNVNRIIDGSVFGIPCFDFVRYVSLIEHPLTIISDDCWGGFVYSYLKLPFLSPFINLYLSPEDYLMLLSDFDYYMSSELKMLEEGDIYEGKFPVGYLGDDNRKVILNFNHHWNFSTAKEDWDRRKDRINENNILIRMKLCDSNMTLAEKFDNLPFEKKFCFTIKELPFKSNVSIPRYIWRCRNKSITAGSTTFPSFLHDMGYLSKTIDVFKLLNGEEKFLREL